MIKDDVIALMSSVSANRLVTTEEGWEKAVCCTSFVNHDSANALGLSIRNSFLKKREEDFSRIHPLSSCSPLGGIGFLGCLTPK